MAGEVLVLNPRRRRRKARAHRAAAPVRRRRRRVARRRYTHARVHNPRRRRRAYRARRHNPRRRRRLHRNPGGKFLGVNLGQVGMIAGGAIAVEVLADKLSKMIPASWNVNADMARIGTKAVVGIGLPLVARRFLPRGWGSAIALGGGIAVALDLFKTYVAPKIGVTLSSYEIGPYAGMQGYETLPAGMAGDDEMSGTAYGSSIYS